MFDDDDDDDVVLSTFNLTSPIQIQHDATWYDTHDSLYLCIH